MSASIDRGATTVRPLPRISSGNRNADFILDGGFPANSINVIMGQPGTGKTVFAEQMLYHNAILDDRANSPRSLLYITTLSEPMSKVVTFVQQMSFFDEHSIGGRIQYTDLAQPLTLDGPQALLTCVRDAIRTSSPRIIVVDSFKAVHDLGLSQGDMRRAIAELSGLLSSYDTTAFLLGEYVIGDLPRYPEFAVADSIVELARNSLTTRDERFFRVLKLRGSSYRAGQHAFRITSAGLELYPRLVSPDVPESYDTVLERVPSGVPGLDPLMSGGLWRGSTTLVIGQTGTGKTTMGLQFALEGVKRGEHVLYVNFQENPIQLRRAMRGLGADPDTAFARGFRSLYASPVEFQVDSIIGAISSHITDGQIQRVVIDAIGDLATTTDATRLTDYLYALSQHFVVQGVTSLLLVESAASVSGQHHQIPALSYLSDNIIVLGDLDTGARKVRVMKTRNSAHDQQSHLVEIGSGGLRIV